MHSLRGVRRDPLLEGSWYLLTNYNWAYNPTYNSDNPSKALIRGIRSRVISTAYNWLVSTMNLQAEETLSLIPLLTPSLGSTQKGS